MKKNRLIFILLINVFLCSISLKSQEYNNENKLFDGNKFHSKKEYINSESKFREAISIDNGIMHMMSLANIPMIVLFGPTNSDKFATNNNFTTVLDSKKIHKTKDINSIEVDEVLSFI